MVEVWVAGRSGRQRTVMDGDGRWRRDSGGSSDFSGEQVGQYHPLEDEGASKLKYENTIKKHLRHN